jgi:hypothetical protein
MWRWQGGGERELSVLYQPRGATQREAVGQRHQSLPRMHFHAIVEIPLLKRIGEKGGR